jgi:pre-peptidase/trypsin
VSSITRNPDFAFGVRSDEAVFRLSLPATGVTPSLINSVAEPPLGTVGDIVGFGSVGELFGPGTSNFKSGIKRRGDVVTAGCEVVPEASNLCWSFTEPIGPPGTDSNTCIGDSGGPLFADVAGLGVAVAGITSGGNTTCLPEDNAFDADVHFDHEWIESVAGGDLAPIACGSTPPVLGPDTEVLFDRGSMDAADLGAVYEVVLPAGRSELRVTTNGELVPFQDFDLYVKRGGQPSVEPPDYDCSSQNGRSFEACAFNAPAGGSWFVMVSNPHAHQGEYDVTVSILGDPVGPCAPLDLDGDGLVVALNDGLLAVRGLFGFTGIALTAGALGDGATRDAVGVVAFIDQCAITLDVDGDGSASPLTDGLLFLRYLFGLRGVGLTAGTVGSGCKRCDADAIEPYLAALVA